MKSRLGYFGSMASLAVMMAEHANAMKFVSFADSPDFSRPKRLRTGITYPMNGKRECARRVRQAEAIAAKRAA